MNTKFKLNVIHQALSVMTLLSTIVVSAQNTGDEYCSERTGVHDNFYFTHYTDGAGTACFTLGNGGNYNYFWENANVMVGGKGWNPGSATRVVGYNAGNYTTNSGNSYLALYGWAGSGNSLVEYYVVDSWGGNFRPPGRGQAVCTVQSDGGTYDIYRTQQVNLPSIESGSDTFFQYWSVRRSKRSMGGNNEITFKNHVDAWARQGWNLGTQNYQVMGIEGNFGSGSANLSTWDAGSSNGSNSGSCFSGGSGSSGGNSSGAGNPGNGEYTVTVRARGASGGERLRIQINGQTQATIILSTNWQNYNVFVNRGNMRVRYDNDTLSRDAFVDWVQVHGTRRQAESRSVNTAVWENGSCGGDFSETMNCNGFIDFGDITFGNGFGGKQLNEITTEPFTVYPNPSSGLVLIDMGVDTSKATSVVVYNASGQQVFATEIEGDNTRIDLNDQSSGLYFIALENNGQVLGRQKVVIE